MKPWLKRTLIGIFGATALLGSFAAFSQHGHHRWHAMSEAEQAELKARIVQRVGAKLDLDEAQKARLSTLADTLREQRRAVVGDPQATRAEVESLIAGPAFDRNKAQVLVLAKTQAVQAASPGVIGALADFYDSLRPEQQARLRDLLQRGRAGWRS